MLTANAIEKLRLIQRSIKEHPAKFFMEEFFTSGASTIVGGEVNCGTAACIAGWALTLRYMKENKVDFNTAVKVRPTFGANSEYLRSPYWCAGRAELELTEEQAGRLFSVLNWPFDFRVGYVDNDGCCVTLSYEERVSNANLAVARIEHFIKTGGDE